MFPARSAASAKGIARRRWLKGLKQVHKDDLHAVAQDPVLDDLLPITGNGQWHLRLTEVDGVDADGGEAADGEAPDWYGYRLI